MMRYMVWFFLSCRLFALDLGVDVFFEEKCQEWKGKRIGLITNQSGVNRELVSTLDLFLSKESGMRLVAVFAPEHGLFGEVAAEKEVGMQEVSGIPVYSLYGKTRRPTAEMLQGVDALVYDIQDIGSRSYTYATTLYYVMEEAAKYHIPVIVLDRPNPLGGNWVDGPFLEGKYRSFIGYMDIPYCHGMTIGELARYFNGEYKIGCHLQVVRMRGWKRGMRFQDTGLNWVPTSPYIPDPDTPLFYATTGWLGQLGILNIGIGYTLPFKVIGAPWIDARGLAANLNKQKIGGVVFVPFHFTPQYGLYKGEKCQGVLIVVSNPEQFRPVRVQCFLLGMLKSMYPKIVMEKLRSLPASRKELFFKAVGGEEIFSLLLKEKYPSWKLVEYQKERRGAYLEKRKKYLLYN